MLGLGISVGATLAAHHFASAARARAATPLAWSATVLAWLDAAAVVALALGLFG